jgi:hypothetical protein
MGTSIAICEPLLEDSTKQISYYITTPFQPVLTIIRFISLRQTHTALAHNTFVNAVTHGSTENTG